MTTDKQDPSRTAFEAWYIIAYDPASLRPIESGCYTKRGAGMAWDAWQASRKQALEDVIQELSGMSCNNATARSAIKVCIETIKEMK